MPIDHLKDQNPSHPVSVASDLHGDSGGDRHEVGAGASDFGETRRRIARYLAKEGLGHEDIVVRMRTQARLEREPWDERWRPVVARIVLRER